MYSAHSRTIRITHRKVILKIIIINVNNVFHFEEIENSNAHSYILDFGYQLFLSFMVNHSFIKIRLYRYLP